MIGLKSLVFSGMRIASTTCAAGRLEGLLERRLGIDARAVIADHGDHFLDAAIERHLAERRGGLRGGEGGAHHERATCS